MVVLELSVDSCWGAEQKFNNQSLTLCFFLTGFRTVVQIMQSPEADQLTARHTQTITKSDCFYLKPKVKQFLKGTIKKTNIFPVVLFWTPQEYNGNITEKWLLWALWQYFLDRWWWITLAGNLISMHSSLVMPCRNLNIFAAWCLLNFMKVNPNQLLPIFIWLQSNLWFPNNVYFR